MKIPDPSRDLAIYQRYAGRERAQAIADSFGLSLSAIYSAIQRGRIVAKSAEFRRARAAVMAQDRQSPSSRIPLDATTLAEIAAARAEMPYAPLFRGPF